MDGEFVRLLNHGIQTVSIGGWMIRSESEGKEAVYRFHPQQMLDSGTAITVFLEPQMRLFHCFFLI